MSGFYILEYFIIIIHTHTHYFIYYEWFSYLNVLSIFVIYRYIFKDSCRSKKNKDIFKIRWSTKRFVFFEYINSKNTNLFMDHLIIYIYIYNNSPACMVSTLNLTVSFSFLTWSSFFIFWEKHEFIFSPSNYEIVQIGFFRFHKLTRLGEGKLWIQTSCTSFEKNLPCVTFCPRCMCLVNIDMFIWPFLHV